jgi:hypothetical protein
MLPRAIFGPLKQWVHRRRSRNTEKASIPEREPDAADDLRSEYDFDYRQAKPNRFAGQVNKSQTVVMLDPDISEVFTTPESINAILRALIKTMPKGKPHEDSGDRETHPPTS